MAKYIDSNGLSHLIGKIKATFSVKSHTHPITSTTGDSVTVTPGTAASLTTTNLSIPNISKKTVVTGGTKTAIPNVTDVGEPPTLGTAFTIPNVGKKTVVTGVTKKTVVTGVTKKTVVTSISPMSATVSDGNLLLTADSATTGDSVTVSTGDSVTVSTGDSVTLGTAFTVPNVTSVGSAPTLGDPVEAYTTLATGDSITVGTATSAKGVGTFTANTPTAVTKKTVVTSVSANTGTASA